MSIKPAAVVALVLLAVTARAIPQDEIEQLLTEIDPPARFADHSPVFTVERRSFRFHQADGSVQDKTWRVIRDGRRYVALLTGGAFHLLAFRPDQAPTELVMPTGRWHIDTMLGTLMSTGAFFPGQAVRSDDIANVEHQDQLTGQGTDRLVLTRRFRGARPIRRRRPNRKRGQSKYETITQRLDTTNTFVLRCDPVTGYTIEATFDNAVDPPPDRKQYVNLMAKGTYALWPGEASSDRSVITRKGHDGYQGYYNNLQAFDLCDNDRPRIREGGFAAYLRGPEDWASAMAIQGADAQMIVCNAHADIDFMVHWPDDLPVTDDGLRRLVIRHRLVALPPEVAGHIWEAMEVRFRRNETVTIRMGERVDFEDQPISAASPVRGIINTTGLKLARDVGRSGRQSLRVRGTAWPNLPQIATQPETTYRLEAWAKVRDLTESELEQRRQHHKKRRAKRANKGKDPGPFQPPATPATAYITAYWYEWSPHSNTWLAKHRTNTATADKSGWQKLTLEFTTPKWDPFVDIRFHCPDGVAWFDDFYFGPADPPATARKPQ
jgi:hypothetical protein